MEKRICVFDAYGTLFDINSAARYYAAESENEQFVESWTSISKVWREKQLSYSWLLTILGKYTDFWKITEDSLDYALDFSGIQNDKNLKKRLMELYRELEAFDEVENVLSELKRNNIVCSILSNGSKFMLNAAVKSSKIETLIDSVISVDEIRVFKPDPKVYELVVKKYFCKKKEVLFISSNGWDISGASSFGFDTLWINRSNQPIDRLPFKPSNVGVDLTAVTDSVLKSKPRKIGEK
tara:strand:+ start:93 stop:806 length:714 start_codon:yes stop_codon:yes gene_type:complete